MITLERVSRRYGASTVVDDVSLDIPDGSFCVLIGASGSGKSTTLRMINRLIEPSAGRILLDGTDTAAIPDLRLRMGYAIQSIGLFPHWTIARNIATVPALLGWDRARREARVGALMQTLGLDPALGARYPHELSGGQQQRVGVARALAADPDVLLMDEPFGALDPPTRAGLQAEMRRIHAETGKTIVFVTHDMEEALGLASLLVILDHGRLVQAGPPRSLLAAPDSEFVRDFVGGGESGLRLLALDTVGQRMRPFAGAADAPVIAPAASLRSALALMTEQRVDRLVVQDEAGVRGALHLEDLWREGAGHAPPR